MATKQKPIKIDKDLKEQAADLFEQLGIDMSSAVNIFLRQSLLHGGIPFKIELPQYKQEVYQAMEEARIMSHDPNIQTYNNFSEVLEELDNDL